MTITRIGTAAVKSLIITLIVFFALPAFAGETYRLDPAHTSVVFRVKHLGVAQFYGSFNGATGTFQFDESSPSKNTIELEVKAANVNTGIDKRDNHLKSPDFFNAGEHPVISFKSKSVMQSDNGTYKVSGDLNILGKTSPITVEAKETGSGKDPWGKYRKGFETSFTVKRSEFGMNYMLGGLSDEVLVIVSVEGIRQ